MKKITNRDQFGVMVGLMKENEDIAQNRSKRTPEQIKQFWEILQRKINSLGPPIKEVVEWKKVWSDYKSNIKKKLTFNKRELNATGGGPNKIIQFTPEEEDVIALTSLKECIDGVRGAKSFGVQRTGELKRRRSTSSELPFNEFDDLDNISVNLSRDEEPKASCSKFHKEQPRMKEASLKNPTDVLKSRIEIQRDLCNTVKKGIEQNNENAQSEQNSSRRIYKALESMEKTNREVKQRILELELERRASNS